MSELTIEQKAKLYDEVIERAKKWYNAPNVDKIPTFGNRIIEDIFPELYESEDEKIRKALISVLQSDFESDTTIHDISVGDIIAWLEKQGQSKKISIWKHWKNGIAGNGEGKLTFLIKSGPAYSLSSCLSFECDYIELSELDNFILEKQGEQKPSWSEEDEISFLDALWCCKKAASIAKDENEMGTVWYAERWLKSLKERAKSKQGEQKSADKVEPKDYNNIDPHFGKLIDKIEPKFKDGQWIVFNGLTLYINEVVKGYYRTISKGGVPNSYDWNIDNAARLWTLQDAKDGDILWHSDSASNGIFIFKEIRNDGKILCYCDYDSEDHFCLGEHHTCCWTSSKYVKPATKEQRNLLFAKMHKAGYEWNSDKRELTKK